MDEKLLELLLGEIKAKSQFSALSDEFLLQRVSQFFLTRGDLRKKLEKVVEDKGLDKLAKNATFKEVLKLLRQELGIIYGSFQTSEFKKKEKLLLKITSKEEVDELFFIHKSSRERVDFYEEIFEKIFAWYQPQKVADLACGMNPLSYFIQEKILSRSFEYFASDLSSQDMDFLNSFFEKFSLKAQAKAYDITSMKFLEDKEFLSCDLVYLFKALDSFEEIKRGISKELLEKIPAQNIVVSFPTKSLKSKKEFSNTHKGWLRKIIEDNSWKYETFEVENELFFLISK